MATRITDTDGDHANEGHAEGQMATTATMKKHTTKNTDRTDPTRSAGPVDEQPFNDIRNETTMALAIPNGLDNSSERPGERAPLVLGETTYHDITESVCCVAERPPSAGWVGGFLFSFALLQMLGLLILYLIYTGVGVWGNRSPIFWGWPIVNFVFWVGIGHAGTLISAILFLFRQEWRTSINRAAEAMTIFAVACAGTFPGIHVGRAWLAFWLRPIPV